jgi:hypothetical protein
VSAIKIIRNYASSVSMSESSFETLYILEKEIEDIHKQKIQVEQGIDYFCRK